jgi:glycosyltransferase involved in cell wall biosynthesis
MRVLLSAYGCEPGKGSEAGVGWNSVQQAARFHDVWVLTQTQVHQAIEAALSRRPIPSVRFVYVDLPPWALFWKKGLWGRELHYYLWQLAAYFVGRKLHREVGFDLVHHVTVVRYWMPSFLALLPVPFIWGPVGGGESAPDAFRAGFSVRGKISEALRDIGRALGELDPFVRLTAERAAIGLATTEETAERMRTLGCKRLRVLPQVGLAQEEIERLSGLPLRHSGPFRLISVGRLLHWKGFHLGLRAFAQFQREFPASEYWIVGDGPERKGLESLARRLGVAGSVTFWGTVPRHGVFERLAECDALVHPSLHESGGYVCSEAMAAGRPVICMELGGPAVQVSGETGVRVRVSTPERAIAEISKAMSRLANDPVLRARMGLAARRRVETLFRWDDKGHFLSALYEGASQAPQSR